MSSVKHFLDLTEVSAAELRRSLPHLPADLPALFLPTQAVGFSPEHTAFAGTLTLKAETVIRLWTDIAESVAANDAVVNKTARSRMIDLSVSVGDEFVTRVKAEAWVMPLPERSRTPNGDAPAAK